jgi:DNA-binding NtrC family response regulator
MQLPNNRIMIVDDNIEFSETLKLLLTKYGYECEVFHNKNEALENFKNNFSIFILDIDLEDHKEAGLELLKEIKSFKPMSSIIMVTGKQSYDYLINCISSGACDFFIKSKLDKEYIFNTIEREIQKQQNWLSVMSNIKNKSDEFFEFNGKKPLINNYKIAFIEDDPSFTDLLKNVCQKLKIKTDIYEHPEELIASGQSYNLIFSDLWIKKEHGIEYIKKFKSLNPFTDIVVISGDISPDTMALCSEYGVMDYIFKESFNTSILSSMIEHSCNKFMRWSKCKPDVTKYLTK